MVNRTDSPIRLANYGNTILNKQETKGLRAAYLGDGNGNFEALANGSNNEHFGKMWIRFASGTDSNGYTTYTQGVQALVNPNANIPHKNGLPILVYFDRPSQTWVIDRVDVIKTNKAGYNTHVLNTASPRRQLLWERQLQDGKLFATATSTVDSTTVSIQPFAYVFDGAIYNGGKANNIDLSAYIPSAGNERLVVIGQRAHDQTTQVIQGSTRTQTSAKYGLSDIDTLVQQFDDYIIPIGAARLADNSGTVLEDNLHQSLVQRINVPQPRGIQNPVTRHRYIVSGYQETVHGKLYISTGKYELAGKLVLRD